ncbi:MAG TPA: proline iminopeptidase-family hydrolase [Terracidiphilus sp.]|nr:proline iminopeptidase-family hydrolase [Terracidiphilus sp.]
MLIAMKPLRLALIFALASVSAMFGPAQLTGSVYPQQSGYVDAHGVLIYYVEFGKGAPLVVLHGGPGADHTYFLPWLLPLARTHRLIFIDERGSGQSERLQDVSQYTIENMADDVEAVRVALNLGKIDLLGHSCGGVLAEAYALKYQQHLNHLILNSTFASTREMNEVLAREKAQMPPEKLKRLNELEQAGLFGKGAIWEHGRYPEEYETLAWGDGYFPFLYGARPDANYDPKNGNAPTNWELYREMWGSDGEFVIDGNLKSVEYLDRLPTIHVPTLIVAGDHDECDPSLSREMHEKIAGSKLAILPNAGHMNFEDQPEMWQKAVNGFLSGS